MFALLLFMLELKAVDFFVKTTVFTNKDFKFLGQLVNADFQGVE